MGFLIKNDKTVFTLSTTEPLYVYSQTDKYLMAVKREQANSEAKKYGILNGFKNLMGDKFNVDRIGDSEEIQQIIDNPLSVIVNMDFAENCLIAGRDENNDLDGGFLLSTHLDPITGEYYGPSQTGLPNFVIDFFSKKFGETDIEAIREQLNQAESQSGEDNKTTQSGIEQTSFSQNFITMPTFEADIIQDLEQ